METYITKEQFIGRLILDFGSYSGFDAYAVQIQDEVLLNLLGYATYKDMNDNISDAKYQNLLNGVEYTDSAGNLQKAVGIKVMLPYFFYFFYSRDIQSYNSTLGEFESLAENSQQATRSKLNSKIVNNYNQGIVYYDQLIDYMELNSEDYPNLVPTILEKENVFCI